MQVSNVRVIDADGGMMLNRNTRCTYQDIEIGSEFPRGGINGHFGMWIGAGADNLVQRVSFPVKMMHDITLTAYEQQSVVRDCQGVDLNIGALLGCHMHVRVHAFEREDTGCWPGLACSAHVRCASTSIQSRFSSRQSVQQPGDQHQSWSRQSTCRVQR